MPFRPSAHARTLAAIGVVSIAIVAATAPVTAATKLGPYSFPTSSMLPNMRPGDVFYIDPSFGTDEVPDVANIDRYLAIEPARGDVVMFRSTDGYQFVKRVIGLPGESVRMIGGRVHVDGVPLALDDAGVGSSIDPPVEDPDAYRVQVETTPDGYTYRVLNMSDGTPGDDTIAFNVPEGHYFMMGDNRDNSADSRFNLRSIPREAIDGRVNAILLNTRGKGTNGRDLSP